MNTWRLQSSTGRVLFKAYLSSDHLTPATGKTIAVTLSKNGAAFGNPNAGASNATEIANGWYYFAPAAQDRDTLGPVVWRGTEGTIDPTETEELVVDAVRAGLTALPNAAADAAGGLPVSDAGGLDLDARLDAAVSSRATSTQATNIETDTQDIQTRLPAALSGGRMDSHIGSIADAVLTAAKFAAGAFDAVWSVAARLLTAGTNIVLAKGTGVTGFNDPTVGAIADQVWDEAIAGHLGAGSTGAALNAAGSAGDPWTTPLPGAYGAGTAGKIIGDNLDAAVSSRASAAGLTTVEGKVDTVDTVVDAIKVKTDALPTDPADQSLIIAATDAIVTAVGTRASQVSVDDLPTNAELATALAAADDAVLAQLALVKAKTDLIPAAPAAAGDVPTAAANAAALFAAVTETGETYLEAIRVMRAALVGKSSGHAAGTPAYRDRADTKNRISATTDADGNRTAVTTDGA
jgi:hypothetical protein